MLTGLEKGTISVEVIEDVSTVEFKIDWPRSMTDVKLIH